MSGRVYIQWRRRGIGSAILSRLSKYNRCGSLKVVNVQCDSQSMNTFLTHAGFILKCRQFEMVKTLT